MLDDMKLADKVRVARTWFERAQSGEMPFTEATATTYGQLLAQIEAEVALLDAHYNLKLAEEHLNEARAALAAPAPAPPPPPLAGQPVLTLVRAAP